MKNKLAILLIVLLMIISSCVTTKQKFEQVKRIDTIGSYEVFLQEHPNNKYTSWINSRIEELTKQEEREKHLAEKERKLDIENQVKISKLKDYKDGILTEDQFLADGWNVRDPFHSRAGIVGYQCFDLSDSNFLTEEYSTNIIGDRRGRYSIYWLGVDPSSQILAGIFGSSKIEDMMTGGSERFLKKKGNEGNVYMEPSNTAQLACKLIFIDGKLVEIKLVN
ncbi:MAG: hypothetical protein GY797_27010 [Deltaproteobacteria bacterium]|nr:hypothetical protein [Deltaproteobacteria bacterium]